MIHRTFTALLNDWKLSQNVQKMMRNHKMTINIMLNKGGVQGTRELLELQRWR